MVIKIFLFHRVHPSSDPLWQPMHPAHFEKIIAYLNKKFHLVKLEDFLENQTTYKPSKKPPAAVVFDDGYRDFITYALPILSKYKVASSMYIITECANTGVPTWTYTLDYAFLHTQKNNLQFDTTLQHALLQDQRWDTTSAKLHYANRLKAFLKTITHPERQQIITQIQTQLGDVAPPQDLMMNWKEIKEIYNEGVEIGSHTTTHTPLATIKDENHLMNELIYSQQILQEKIGIFPRTISYPVGSYNPLVKQKSKECGYRFGLAVNQTHYNTNKQDLFEIPRIELYQESMFKTKLRITETIQRVKKLINR